MNIDRRDFRAFLAPWFPDLAKSSSEEMHYFLDAVTGLDTPLDMPNGAAFDRWREKLAKIGYPVFDYTDAHIAAMKAKAATMADAEKRRVASLDGVLSELKKEAPNWTAAEVLASAKASK